MLGRLYVNCITIHIKFVTNFHVCNLRFVRSMTSMHIRLNACILDNLEQQKYLFYMVFEQQKKPKPSLVGLLRVSEANKVPIISHIWVGSTTFTQL